MKKNIINTNLSLFGATIFVSCFSHFSVAQEGAIEEIIVTAQKRAENVQDVPIAISATTAAGIEAKAVNEITQLADFTPNVEMDNSSPFSGSSSVLSPFIRGIGQNDFAFNLEPGVGVYVDGVYYARTIGAVIDLLDLDRVEILKGPQGTLFGRNSIGGALNVITRRPSDTTDFKVEFIAGDFNRTDLSAALDLPLTENLLSQVSFSVKQRDGYQERIPFPSNGPINTDSGRFFTADDDNDDEAGGQDQQNIRGKLLWLASDSVEVTFAADYAKSDEQGTPGTLLATDTTPGPPSMGGTLAGLYNSCINLPSDPATGAQLGFPPGLDLQTLQLTAICGDRGTLGANSALASVNVDNDPTNDRLSYGDQFILNDIDKSYAEGSNFNKIDSQGYSGTVDWEISGDLSLKSITAYRELDAVFGLDADGSPLVIADLSFDTHQEQFSQEFQLNGSGFDERLKWTTGLYYFQEEGELTDFVPFAEGLVQVFGQNFFDNTAYAAFGHFNYQFSEAFSATFGVRYTDEDKEFEGRQRELNAQPFKTGFPLAGHPDPTDITRIYPLGVQKENFNDTSTHVGFEWHVDDNMMLYFSRSEGFKSGGWTTRLLVPETPDPNVAPAFDSEEATSYEIGFKSQLADRSIQLNAAIFKTYYDDIQVTVQKGISPTFDNAGEAEIDGFEVEVLALLGDIFTLDASLGYLDARYTKLELFVDPRLDIDDKFVNTPEWSAHIGADWTFPLGGGSESSLRIDYSYKDEIANDTTNNPLFIQDAINLWNASATYRAPEHWELALSGRNLSDERYIVTVFENPGIGFSNATFSRPREWALAFRYHY